MHERISVNPNVCRGQACVKGTRIPVHQIFRMLANGDSIETLLRAFPELQREDILIFSPVSIMELHSRRRKSRLWSG